jgi:UDP-N-acetylmuramate--alanine ligase
VPVISELKHRGIRVVSTFEEKNLDFKEMDLLVHTAAIDSCHPVLTAAQNKGVEILKYAQMLGRLMDHSRGIAVAGSHGKTSVTALCAYLLEKGGMSPSYVIGGHVPDLGGGGGAGTGDWLIAEACEYDRSFLNLKPLWAMITSIEPDHLDYYGSYEELIKAFKEFIQGVAQRKGHLILWDGAFETLKPRDYSGLPFWTYGFNPGSNLVISDFEHTREGSAFSLALEGKDLGRFSLNQPGRHNSLNASAACLLALILGMPASTIKEALPRFQGIHRRLEGRGTFGGVKMFSDYAHHPTEIRAVLDALRGQYPNSRLVVAYQGHQQWRTGFFLEDFGRVLSGFDLSLIMKTFSVREKTNESYSDGEFLAQAIEKQGGKTHFLGDLKEAPYAMIPHLKKGDLLVLMGAGNIDEISEIVKRELSLS